MQRGASSKIITSREIYFAPPIAFADKHKTNTHANGKMDSQLAKPQAIEAILCVVDYLLGKRMFQPILYKRIKKALWRYRENLVQGANLIWH